MCVCHTGPAAQGSQRLRVSCCGFGGTAAAAAALDVRGLCLSCAPLAPGLGKAVGCCVVGDSAGRVSSNRVQHGLGHVRPHSKPTPAGETPPGVLRVAHSHCSHRASLTQVSGSVPEGVTATLETAAGIAFALTQLRAYLLHHTPTQPGQEQEEEEEQGGTRSTGACFAGETSLTKRHSPHFPPSTACVHCNPFIHCSLSLGRRRVDPPVSHGAGMASTPSPWQSQEALPASTSQRTV